MGTSTNLVVYGLMQEKDPSFSMSMFGLFSCVAVSLG